MEKERICCSDAGAWDHRVCGCALPHGKSQPARRHAITCAFRVDALVTEIDIFCRWAATQSDRVGALGGGGTMGARTL